LRTYKKATTIAAVPTAKIGIGIAAAARTLWGRANLGVVARVGVAWWCRMPSAAAGKPPSNERGLGGTSTSNQPVAPGPFC
jgi:hypothetical protein